MVIYDDYSMSNCEKIKYALMGMMISFLLIYLFYGSLLFGGVFSVLGLCYLPYKKRALVKVKKKKLKEQFKEGIYALSSSISAGKSIEVAFVEALKDLRVIYQDEETYILKEFELIVYKVSMNETVESALLDFSRRANDEDVRTFVNVFIIAKRTGGNLVNIIKYTTSSIHEKLEIISSIDVMVSGKKYEQKLLALMLPVVILYLKLFSEGFLESLYHCAAGKIAMTLSLFLYIFSFVIGQRIVEIEV